MNNTTGFCFSGRFPRVERSEEAAEAVPTKSVRSQRKSTAYFLEDWASFFSVFFMLNII